MNNYLIFKIKSKFTNEEGDECSVFFSVGKNNHVYETKNRTYAMRRNEEQQQKCINFKSYFSIIY